MLMLLELNPLNSLFSNTEIITLNWEDRLIMWLLAFVWHAIVASILFTLMKFKHLGSKFRPALAAYFGVFILLQVMGVFLQLISLKLIPNALQKIMLIVWLSWGFGVFGYVFRNALEVKFYQGVVVALVVNTLSYALAFIAVALPFSSQLMPLIFQK